jgi:hypothetical protein
MRAWAAHEPRHRVAPGRRRPAVLFRLMPAIPCLKLAHDLRARPTPAFGSGKMGRENRQGIAQSLVDLTLRHIARVFQAGAGEIGSAQSGAREIRALEQRLAQIRPVQIGAVEPRVAEIGTGQIGHLEIGAAQRGETQGGVSQPGEREIYGTAIDRAHLPLGRVKRNAGEFWGDGGILRAPLIPRPGAASQHLDMIGL